MGQNKLWLKIGNVTLLDRVHDALVSCCEEILIVGAKGDTPAGVRRISDVRPGEGPLAGIEAGLLAARHRAVFVTAADMPFLTVGFVEFLLSRLSTRLSAVIPVFEDRPHPLCAVYGREVQPVVSAALDRGVRSVRELLRALPEVCYIEEELLRFGDPNLLLMNVNSPADLARAQDALREGVSRGG